MPAIKVLQWQQAMRGKDLRKSSLIRLFYYSNNFVGFFKFYIQKVCNLGKIFDFVN